MCAAMQALHIARAVESPQDAAVERGRGWRPGQRNTPACSGLLSAQPGSLGSCWRPQQAGWRPEAGQAPWRGEGRRRGAYWRFDASAPLRYVQLRLPEQLWVPAPHSLQQCSSGLAHTCWWQRVTHTGNTGQAQAQVFRDTGGKRLPATTPAYSASLGRQESSPARLCAPGPPSTRPHRELPFLLRALTRPAAQ